MINNLVKQLSTALLILGLIISLTAESQTTVSTKNKNPFPVKYTSLIDQKIILKTITLAPVYDNLDGIYANAIQKLLVDLLQSDKVWGYSEFPEINKKIFIETFDTAPNDVLEVLAKTGAQGLLTAYITKGPRGLNAKLKLFTQDQGLILIEEYFQDLDIFEISKLRDQFVKMYHSIKNKLPYRGYVLSRRGLDVTLNLGAVNGVHLGQELSLAQILKLNRHPKLKTIVGAEKEIIAKLKVTQVEPYLSFAQIIFEKETGVTDVGAKVLPTVYIAYPLPIINAEGDVTGDSPVKAPANLGETTDHPTPLVPPAKKEETTLMEKENSFGILTLQGVITQYKESTELISGGNVSSANSLAPGINLAAQIYPFKNIFINMGTQFSSFSSSNSLINSIPKNLSHAISHLTASVGYDYILEEPDLDDQIKITTALGFASYKTNVSAATPTALTSTQTDSLVLRLKAAMPLISEYSTIVGASLDLFFSSQFTESPVNSGTSKPSITSLSLFGTYPVSHNLNVRVDLSVTNIQTNFSGTGTRTNQAASTSIQTINEQIGFEYLF